MVQTLIIYIHHTSMNLARVIQKRLHGNYIGIKLREKEKNKINISKILDLSFNGHDLYVKMHQLEWRRNE